MVKTKTAMKNRRTMGGAMQKKQVKGKKGASEKAASETPAIVAVEEQVSAGKVRPAPKNRAGRDAAKKAGASEPVQQLVQELEAMRSVLVEVVEQYRERMATQLGTLKKSLESEALKESDISRMLDEIRSVRLKPEKGRVKDLERLQDLLKRLGKRLPERP
jgi:hypothetical protein